MYMSIYIYIHTYIHIYTYICIYVHVYIYTRIYIYVCMSIYLRADCAVCNHCLKKGTIHLSNHLHRIIYIYCIAPYYI